MEPIFNRAKFSAYLKIVKPWAVALVVILFLRYTGMLAGVIDLFPSELPVSGSDLDEVSHLAEPFNYDFRLKDLEGNKYNFTDYKGKVVFLNLWATWCGPCRAEMPGIQSLFSKINNENIQFVMLSIDQDGQQQKVRKYIADKQFKFPVFMPSGRLTQQLSVPSIPTTFIINKQGKIVQKKIGTTNFDTPKFKKYLEDLVAE